MNLKKIVAFIAVAGIIVAGIVAFVIYNKAFVPNTKFTQNEVYVYIPTNASYEEVKDTLSHYLVDLDKFDFMATNRKYNQNIKAGRFLLKKGMSNFDVVRALRLNVPVKVAFNNQESIGNLAGRLASQTEPDSLDFVKAFTDPTFLSENEFTEETVLALFIPDTYEFYWNTSAEKIADKMAKSYRRFWNNERRMKAADKNLSLIQVATLASIVHKETVKVEERPRVAGVYLNRLATGMPLQADPTIIYALKKRSGDYNQVIKRVLYEDLKIDSPYNTYVNAGLPPAPITMPDISAIDAVLNAEKHDYYYFCASPSKPGYHAFAANYAQHQINAREYSQWVNKLGINR
ncbi:endolytic transglycosylase MltG [Flavobacterium sp. TP390]|uniref:Endolytic murein transglycosylase n=1 Tax=Flavobacterium profundi TaxID=1774945 RepID=A0A6I4IU09_9FLAO|nr:endolytic transglycosylase MltG [Flavobacterium profundi]MVO10377.1 endolytic transglycosylase MltG [Flavobacterium profundi]